MTDSYFFRRGGKTSVEISDARRESHKIIEQKRRQKINEKINELRELLNYPGTYFIRRLLNELLNIFVPRWFSK